MGGLESTDSLDTHYYEVIAGLPALRTTHRVGGSLATLTTRITRAKIQGFTGMLLDQRDYAI